MKQEDNTPSSAELFVRMVGIIWFCAAIGAAFSKDSMCMGAALVVTVIAGYVYVERHE